MVLTVRLAVSGTPAWHGWLGSANSSAAPHLNQLIIVAKQVRIKQEEPIVEQGDLTVSGNNANFSISSSAAIAKEYVDQANLALINGLLIQGHVDLGLFNQPAPGADLLFAKLQVQGANKKLEDAALNVTN